MLARNQVPQEQDPRTWSPGLAAVQDWSAHRPISGTTPGKNHNHKNNSSSLDQHFFLVIGQEKESLSIFLSFITEQQVVVLHYKQLDMKGKLDFGLLKCGMSTDRTEINMSSKSLTCFIYFWDNTFLCLFCSSKFFLDKNVDSRFLCSIFSFSFPSNTRWCFPHRADHSVPDQSLKC